MGPLYTRRAAESQLFFLGESFAETITCDLGYWGCRLSGQQPAQRLNGRIGRLPRGLLISALPRSFLCRLPHA